MVAESSPVFPLENTPLEGVNTPLLLVNTALLAPSAAAIICRSFCGLLSQERISRAWSLSELMAICEARLETSLSSPDWATKRTMLMRIADVSPKDFFSSSAKTEDLLPEFMKARTKREKSSSVVAAEKRIMARPAELSIWAKLRSAAAPSSGIPSSSNCVPETPSSTPVFSGGSAAHSSFQATLNCSMVRVWSHPYRRAYFNKMFRLRAKERAARERAVSIVPGGGTTVYHLASKEYIQSLLPRDRAQRYGSTRVTLHLGICTLYGSGAKAP